MFFISYKLSIIAGSFEERKSELSEEFKKSLFHIANEVGLSSQNYKCFQCDSPIGIIYGPALVCHFNGKYYCAKCHNNDVRKVNLKLIRLIYF